MAKTLSRVSPFVPLLLILLAATNVILGDQNNRQTVSAGGGGGLFRNLRGIQRKNQIVDCSDLASKSHCSQYPTKCRWCRSQALDDMCFSKSEAWRLPPQVFTCD